LDDVTRYNAAGQPTSTKCPLARPLNVVDVTRRRYLIQSEKLNDVEPPAWLTDVLHRIVRPDLPVTRALRRLTDGRLFPFIRGRPPA
jgi:hypothetical protein